MAASRDSSLARLLRIASRQSPMLLSFSSRSRRQSYGVHEATSVWLGMAFSAPAFKPALRALLAQVLSGECES